MLKLCIFYMGCGGSFEVSFLACSWWFLKVVSRVDEMLVKIMTILAF